MIVEWNEPCAVEFPENDLLRICDCVREEGWNEAYVRELIDEVVRGFDDADYFMWGSDQSEVIFNVIKRRIGGQQISMFEEE